VCKCVSFYLEYRNACCRLGTWTSFVPPCLLVWCCGLASLVMDTLFFAGLHPMLRSRTRGVGHFVYEHRTLTIGSGCVPHVVFGIRILLSCS
jgi:hypothetical protein